MQDIKLRCGEVIKINGKRYVATGVLRDTTGLKEITSEEESKMLNLLVESALLKELDLGILKGETEDGYSYIDLYENVGNLNDYVRIYIRYLRRINNPANFGLENREDYKYYIYWDFDKFNIIWILCFKGNKLMNIIKDYKDKVLDGDYIK